MNIKFIFPLFTLSCVFAFQTPIKAEEHQYLSSAVIESFSKFIVVASSVECLKGLNGLPSYELIKTYSRGQILYPKRWKNWSPYTEYSNKAYLWVSYNDIPDEGCYVEARTTYIEPTGKIIPIKQPISQTKTIEKTKVPTKAFSQAENKSKTKLKEINYVFENSENIKCTLAKNNSFRYIETNFENIQKKLPCEVTYYKEDGTSRVIAKSQFTQGYCEEKSLNLVKKLTASGWICE